MVTVAVRGEAKAVAVTGAVWESARVVCTMSENRLLTGTCWELECPAIYELEECDGETNSADIENANTGEN